MTLAVSPWIIRFQPRPTARSRLFCFPYAGGGASVYRLWPSLLSDAVELCAVQLPGRESRLKERPYTHLGALVEAATLELQPWLDRPFAFFGHSLGGLIAFEVVRALGRLDPALRPVQLFVSGRVAPGLPRSVMDLHHLPDTEFARAVVERYNGIPQVVLETPELLEYFIPVLRADFTLIETHTHQVGPPVTCPISVFGGTEDERAPLHWLEPWCQYTSAECEVHRFPGGHFFLNSARDLVVDRVNSTLQRQLQKQWARQPANP